MKFLRNHWFDVGGFFALITAVCLFLNYKSLSRYEILMWISLITLFLHQLEEYRIACTFPGMLNTVVYKSTTPDRYPLNTHTAFLVNVVIGWSLYLLAAVLSEKAVWIGIASLTVSFGNIIAHTTLFNIKGKTWYNAGLFTSWFCFFPVICFFVVIAKEDHVALPMDFYTGIPLGMLINFIGVVKLIEWEKDPHSSFIFPPRCLLKNDRK